MVRVVWLAGAFATGATVATMLAAHVVCSKRPAACW